MTRRRWDWSGVLTLAAVVLALAYFGAHLYRACEAGRLPVCRVDWGSDG